MNAPPDVPPRRKRVPDWLREALFIVASIALALAADEWRENRSNRELALRVLRSVDAELQHNLAQIERFVDVHRRWADALDKTDPSQGRRSGIDVYAAARPPLPEGARANFPTEIRRGAWDAAVSTGALRFIDYDLVAAISEIYGVQEYYGKTIDTLGGAVTGPPAFDPAVTALTVRQMVVGMREVAFAEQLLIDLYRRHLPAVRAAAAE